MDSKKIVNKNGQGLLYMYQTTYTLSQKCHILYNDKYSLIDRIYDVYVWVPQHWST